MSFRSSETLESEVPDTGEETVESNFPDKITEAIGKYQKEQEGWKKSEFNQIDPKKAEQNLELKEKVVSMTRNFELENRYDVEHLEDMLEKGIISIDDVVEGLEHMNDSDLNRYPSRDKDYNKSTTTDMRFSQLPMGLLDKLPGAKFTRKDGLEISYKDMLSQRATEKEKEAIPEDKSLKLYHIGEVARLRKAAGESVLSEQQNETNKAVNELLEDKKLGSAHLAQMIGNSAGGLRVLFENGIVSEKQTKDLLEKFITDYKEGNEKQVAQAVYAAEEATRLGLMEKERVEELLKS